jgi:hypothetical protein
MLSPSISQLMENKGRKEADFKLSRMAEISSSILAHNS